MNKIYTVTGHTGEYSDYTVWKVKVFKSKDKANKLKNKLDEIYFRHRESFENNEMMYFDRSASERLKKEILTYDPFFHLDYTGTYYTVDELEFDDE